jgi:serine/threonine protein kinase
MAFKLIITSQEGQSESLDLGAYALPVVIGRDSDQAQIVLNDPQVSRAHAKLSEARGGLLIEDLDSRNGCLINGTRIQRGLLTSKDVLKVGLTELTVAEVEPPDPLEGQTLGNYHLQQVIGTGSYGTVYRAVQLNLARPVAIKVLSRQYASDPQRVQSFQTEAGRAGRLNHPNLVQVHDVFTIKGHYLLVMELLQESTMDQLEDHGPFEESVLLRILRDITRALAYADQSRIVHRDVKPDNILVNEEGTYKLADLGIAMPMNCLLYTSPSPRDH